MIDVLFVDDDPDVLEGLQNRLHPLRQQLRGRFADSGEAALQALSERCPDVVVTDMRMPGMDGAALLRTVRQRYPQTVRIILSGETGTQGFLSAISSAHQVLAKPCDVKDLQGSIEETLALQRALHSPDLMAVLGRVQRLPAPPRITQQLNALLLQPDVGLSAVADVIRADPALAARVLQLVNSAYFTRGYAVDSIVDAVRVLGLDLLRGVVLAAELYADFAGRPHLAPTVQQIHDLALAVVQRVERLAGSAAERPLLATAAMVQDVGLLALLGSEVGRECDADGELDFGLVSAYLLSLWGLPYAVVRTVAWARQPARHGQVGLTPSSRLHLATVLALRDRAGASALPWAVEPTLDHAWAHQAFAPGQLASWLAAQDARHG